MIKGGMNLNEESDDNLEKVHQFNEDMNEGDDEDGQESNSSYNQAEDMQR